MSILAVNAGSSSLKFSIHPLLQGAVQPCVLTGNIEGLEPAGTPVMGWTFQGERHSRELTRTHHGGAFAQALHSLAALLASDPAIPAIKAIAHRVVHGGQYYRTSVRITDDVMVRLEQLNSLAPLHQPHNLQGIRAFQKVFPALPQVACFDTAFHTTLPEVNHRFALPAEVTGLGVRRYGFHGLSYQYISGVLQEYTPAATGRVLMAHLGNGASLCAARGGQSCATTMGFSALDGLMMGTRCGALDPGVMLYLLEQGWNHERLQKLLYKQSGLLGVSGISADMRRLRADGSAAARQAIDLLTHHVVREAGALVACMQGLDVLAFSGGIGEHDAVLRQQVCEQLGWMGVAIDFERNQQATGDTVAALHAPESCVQVWVVPTDEGLVAAREAARLM